MTPWVGRIIFANVAVFVAGFFIPGFDEYARAWGAFIPGLFLARPWTVLTYAFLHQGLMHIFFNMLVLFMFGPRVEMELGSKRFLVLYLVSAIAGGLLSYATPHAAIIGASGATFGIMYAFAKYWPKTQIFVWFVPLEARYAIIVMVALQLYGGIRGGSTIAHFAHLGGFLGAYLYLRLVDVRHKKTQIPAKLKAPRASRDELHRWAKIRREQMHEVNREEFDRIIEKIEKEGVGGMTAQERLFLDNFSERAGASGTSVS